MSEQAKTCSGCCASLCGHTYEVGGLVLLCDKPEGHDFYHACTAPSGRVVGWHNNREGSTTNEEPGLRQSTSDGENDPIG